MRKNIMRFFMMNRVRIGVDVGGTFTKSVAIDMDTGRIIGKVTVPTLHFSQEEYQLVL